MTAHDPALRRPDESAPPHFVAARRLVRPLAWLAFITLLAAVALFVLSRPIGVQLVPALHLPGLGMTAGSLMIAAFGLIMCLGMVVARRRELVAAARMRCIIDQTHGRRAQA